MFDAPTRALESFALSKQTHVYGIKSHIDF